MLSGFAGKVRTGAFTSTDFGILRRRFLGDIRTRVLIPIRMTNIHYQIAGELISKHAMSRQLRTLDALQLSVALHTHQQFPIDMILLARRGVHQEIRSLETTEFLSRDREQILSPESISATISSGFPNHRGEPIVTDAARYVKVVEWSNDDGMFVGQCPGIIGPCCHGSDEVEVYRQLCEIVEEWIEIARQDGRPLPPPTTGMDLARKIA